MTSHGQMAGRRSDGAVWMRESGVSAVTSAIYPRAPGAAIAAHRHGLRPLTRSQYLQDTGPRPTCCDVQVSDTDRQRETSRAGAARVDEGDPVTFTDRGFV